MMTTPVRLQMMDCSTGHLSITTREWLDADGTCEKHGFMSRDTGYALSTWLGTEANWPNHPEVPRDLLHVLRYANANGMDWVLFDSDADRDPNLPWYEDMTGKPEMPESMNPDIIDFPDGHSPWAVDPKRITPAEITVTEDRVLEDENYVIPEGEGVWIGVAGTSIRVKDSEGSVTITAFVDGFEMDDPISETVHTRDEISEERAALEAAAEDGPGI